MGIYRDDEIEKLREVGKLAATLLKEISEWVRPGISLNKIDEVSGKMMKKLGVKSAPKLLHRFPGHICLSKHPVIAHGMPSEQTLLPNDMLNIDIAIEKDGYFSDIGYTFLIGEGLTIQNKVIECSKNALELGINSCADLVPLNDVGACMHDYVKSAGLTIIQNLCSHGVGKSLHEEPGNIFNYAHPDQKQILKAGMIIALEPYVSSEACRAIDSGDSWSMTTHNESYVAQFEHTILITLDGSEILTQV